MILLTDLHWKVILSASALLLALCPPVQAASDFNLNTKSGNPGVPAEYSWDGNTKVLMVKDGADIAITGNVTDGTRSEVAGGARAAVTFDNVSISGIGPDSRAVRRFMRSKQVFRESLEEVFPVGRELDPDVDIGLGSNQSPLALNPGAMLKLTLRGKNTLTAGDCTLTKPGYCAGIEVSRGTALNIDGTGALTTTGGRGFGYGIGNSGYCGRYNSGKRCIGDGGGTITISGGTVTANPSEPDVHGSGGSSILSGGSIIITGGTVTTTNGGIYSGDGETIAIRGGVVTADRGIRSDDGGAITISGGMVTAKAGGIGGKVGGGARSNGKSLTITISGGTVTAQGGSTNPGIGGSIYGTDVNINISITGDANVTALGGDGNTLGGSSGGGAGIGGIGSSYTREVGTIRIDTTGTVNAIGGKGFKSGSAGANIGQGGGVRTSSEVSTGAGIKGVGSPSPANASVAVGGTASFTCDIAPMPDAPAPRFTLALQYSDRASAPKQWAPTTLFKGGTSAVFSLPDVTSNMAGQYRCVVLATDFPRGGTFKNHAEEKRSAPASSILYIGSASTLTVTPGN